MKSLLIKKEEFFLIALGALFVSVSISWFLSPANLVVGGISGLGIIVEELSSQYLGFTIPISLTTIVCNLPLFLLSSRRIGFDFLKKSLLSVVLVSFFIEVTSSFPSIFTLEEDLLVTALIAGVGLGAGIGLVLKAGATTGGTDMIASLIHQVLPQQPMSRLVMFVDGIIIVIGFFIFGPNKAAYAMVSIYVTGRVISSMLDGVHYGKAAFIISNKSEEIAQAIMDKIPRGSTGLKSRGMYSKMEGEMLFTVVAPTEVTKLRELIYSIDPKAFVTIADVREVLGQGFTEVNTPSV
ncbi:MAG: hypothetical protein ATN36_05450 [Epulopiscium sp. Nele67-Bin005]|nr:MAG: hypothetical protein ATN36_05450 [Epulopiscium sp. Nele67-Bin005]